MGDIQQLRTVGGGGESAAMQRTHVLCTEIMSNFDATREAYEKFVAENGMGNQQNAKSLLYEFDLKLREAWHRVQDICAASMQSPRAAQEAAGGGS
jgi:hypothetical protein